jgi:hypothetical protein
VPPDKRRQGGKVNRHTAGPVTGTGKASRQESAGNQAESKAKPIDRLLDQPHNQVGHAGQRSPVAAPVDTSQVPQTAIVSGQADTLQLVARAAAGSVGQEPGKAAKRNWLPGSFQARLGVAADYNGGNKIAGGPAVELLLGSRFGVNTGLLFSSPDRQQHPEPQEFHKATGRRFEDDYRRHMPRYDRIDRIKVKTTMLRLPLTLNYYFPTQSRLSFFIHGGTVLDLKAYQSVEFNSTYRGEDRKNRFEETPALKTFNNLILGAGGQYRFGRFVGQVTPYFDFNVRGQDYFNRKGKFGVNTSIKFDLTK